MFNLVFFNYTLAFLGVLAALIGAIVFTYKTWKDSSKNYDQDTIIRLKESNEILRSENADLRTKLAAMDVRIKLLEKANDVLQGVVTGKDTLEQIQNTLSLFKPYIASYDQFITNNKIIMEKLDLILNRKE